MLELETIYCSTVVLMRGLCVVGCGCCGVVCGVVWSGAADRQTAPDDRYARIVKPGPPFPHCKKQLGPGDGFIYPQKKCSSKLSKTVKPKLTKLTEIPIPPSHSSLYHGLTRDVPSDSSQQQTDPARYKSKSLSHRTGTHTCDHCQKPLLHTPSSP